MKSIFEELKTNNIKTIVIAEVADSHNGSIDTAKKLVDSAKDSGADVVKFQLHLPDIEMVPGKVKMWDGDLYEILNRNLFTIDMHKEIKKYCEHVGVEYLCTPFCSDAVDILHNELNVSAFKTGSGEIANLPFHRKLAKISAISNKSVIVSTGMCTMDEIEETVNIYKEEGAKDNLILMNCTSEYPPNDYTHANLGLIDVLKNKFNTIVGQSDHTVDNYTAYAAVARGAKIIEKHFTLSRKQKGPDHFISLEPEMFKELVEGIRKIEVGLGSKKEISSEEQKVRDWAFHSVVASCNIAKGEKLTMENLMSKRPGIGIEAKYLDVKYSNKLLGKKASKNLFKNDILQWSDIE